MDEAFAEFMGDESATVPALLKEDGEPYKVAILIPTTASSLSAVKIVEADVPTLFAIFRSKSCAMFFPLYYL